MNWQLIVMGFLPLLVFVIVDSFASLRIALIVAVIFAAIEVLFSYFYFGDIDQVTWVSLGLVLILGFLAYRLDNSRIFKFQPVILGVVTAAIIAYFQFFDEPIFLKFLPKMKMMASPEQLPMLNSPVFQAKLAVLSGHLIIVFLVHAAITAYAAVKMSNLAWLLIRGIGIWVLLIGTSLIDMRM